MQNQARAVLDHDSSDEFIREAIAMQPDLRRRSPQTALDRRVSNEVVDHLKQTGMFRWLQPVRFGGFSGEYITFTKIIRSLAEGCGSTAWIYGVLGEHSWVIAMFPEQAQLDVWGDDPLALASSSVGQHGRGKQVAGGFVVSGTWPFSSGSDHAQWVLLGALIEMENGSTEYRIVLVPRDSVETVDDWHVLGLRGTGSKTLTANELFVPAHRSVTDADLKMGRGPGVALHPEFALCRAPRLLFAGFSLSSVVVGLATRAVTAFAEKTKSRKSSPNRFAEAESVQIKLAEASVEAELADLLVDKTCTENIEDLALNKTFTDQDIALARRNCAYGVKLAYGAVSKVFEIGGGGALYDHSEIQTIFRDASAGSHHMFLNWDASAKLYGKTVLAVPLK